MKEIRLAFMGFGSAGQALAKLLLEQEEQIRKEYGTKVSVVAIATKTRGNLIDAWGIDLDKALKNIETSGRFDKVLGASETMTAQEIAEKVDYDILVELTPLEFSTGKHAIEHVKAALSRGKHAITANKGPVAWAYEELNQLAKKNNCHFLYEATIMDGTPIFNMYRKCLRLCKITEIKGILNATTNLILDQLAEGKPFAQIISDGRKRGFIEANPATDVEGYDAAIKLSVLANVLMGANITPTDISRQGVKGITREELRKADENGNVIKLICRVAEEDGEVKAAVALEEIDKNDIYASVRGTSAIITMKTDLMGVLTIIQGGEDVVQQGAYGIFADVLEIIEAN